MEYGIARSSLVFATTFVMAISYVITFFFLWTLQVLLVFPVLLVAFYYQDFFVLILMAL